MAVKEKVTEAPKSPLDKAVTAAEKAGKGMSVMGYVTKDGDEYRVQAPASIGVKPAPAYFVTRDPITSKVLCTCSEFEQWQSENPDAGFRCCHILAVKYALVADPNGVPEAKAVSAPAKPEIDTKGMDSKQKEEVNNMANEKQEQPISVDTGTEANAHNWFERLSAPIPSQFIKQREGWRDRNGNTHYVDYVEWHTVVDRLNSVMKDSWSLELAMLPSDSIPVFKATISILLDGVTASRDGIGTGKEWNELGIKAASSDAVKRAAVNWGIAIELYKKEPELDSGGGASEPNNTGGGQRQYDNSPVTNPIARSLSDLITAKQIGMCRAISRDLGIDPDEECQSFFQCKTDELSKKAASAFIQHLQDLQKQQESQGAAPPLNRGNWERT